jgi:NAD(P)-dependent dehydrogenase (short-subunit alcohol dehydrogenase family)
MQPAHYVKAEWLAYPELDPEQPEDDRSAGGRAYASSKLCNVLCAYEMSRRVTEAGLSVPDRPIAVNAFAPGLVAGTGLGRDESGLTRLTWLYLLPLMSRLLGFGRTAAEAGADLAHVATAPELSGVTGQYFSGREIAESSPDSYDRDKAEDLWHTSITLSGLRPGESPLLQS